MSYKVCPLCATKNRPNALLCQNCFFDLSRVPIIEEEMATLKLIAKEFSLVLVKDTILGREAFAKEYLQDKAISRKHLKIFYKNNQWYIEDLNSANGTYLNTKQLIPLQSYPLYNNAQINLAHKVEFQIKIDSSQDITIKEPINNDQTVREESIPNDKTINKTLVMPTACIQALSLEDEQNINGYTVKEHLASGGESDAYLVVKNNQEYVLKRYRANMIPQLQMVEKIKELTNRNSQYLVKLIEYWEEERNFYELYEYCKNGNLSDFLKKEPTVFDLKRTETLLNIVFQINQGLKVLHENKIFHRDLKPSNILIRDDFTIALSDFGIARNMDSSTIFTKNFRGSYRYAAPETLSNQFSKKSDYWSLGIILYELVVGENPFSQMGVNAIFSTLLSQEDISIPSEINSKIRVLLNGLLQKDSLKRWGAKEVDNFFTNIHKPSNETKPQEKSQESWEAFGFTTTEQKEWRENSFDSLEANEWKEANFTPIDAAALKAVGITLQEAKYAREQGLTLPEMKKIKTTLYSLIQETKAHYNAVNSIAYAQQEDLLVSGGNDYLLKIWNELASEERGSFDYHTDHIESVAFHPQESIVASASRDKTLRLWDIQKREPLTTLKGNEGYLESIAFSPDGKYIAGGGFDTRVYLWDFRSYKLIATFYDNLSAVTSIAFSYNSKYLASGSEDGTLSIWNIEEQTLYDTITSQAVEVAHVAFHPFEELLAYSADNKLFLWDLQAKSAITQLDDITEVTSLAFSPLGNLIACGREDGSILLWEHQSHGEYSVLKKDLEESYLNDFNFSQEHILAIKKGNEIELYNTLQNSKISSITLKSLAIKSISFHANNQLLACGTSDGFIQIWESAITTNIQKLLEYGFTIQEYFAWSKNGFDIVEAKKWKDAHFDQESAKEWIESEFLFHEAQQWRNYGFGVAEAKEWKDLNFVANIANKYKQEGFLLEDIYQWIENGFGLQEAYEWREEGFSIEQAVAWKKYDIAPKKAKKFQKFGFLQFFLARLLG